MLLVFHYEKNLSTRALQRYVQQEIPLKLFERAYGLAHVAGLVPEYWVDPVARRVYFDYDLLHDFKNKPVLAVVSIPKDATDIYSDNSVTAAMVGWNAGTELATAPGTTAAVLDIATVANTRGGWVTGRLGTYRGVNAVCLRSIHWDNSYGIEPRMTSHMAIYNREFHKAVDANVLVESAKRRLLSAAKRAARTKAAI